MKKHIHQWKVWSRTDKETVFHCDCKALRSRQTTPAEKARIKKQSRDFDHNCELQNRVCHEFERKFMAWKTETCKIGKAKPMKFTSQVGWKWSGYELMERIYKWAKKYPEDVIICGIDDTHFASSDIVFVLHRIKRRLWGTSCYVITQCDGIPPKEFFMYPGHREGIQEALAKMARYRPMGI